MFPASDNQQFGDFLTQRFQYEWLLCSIALGEPILHLSVCFLNPFMLPAPAMSCSSEFHSLMLH